MSTAENIEKRIKNFCEARKSAVTTSDDMDKKVLNDALAAYEKSETKKATAHQPLDWRIIMKKPISKFAAAAAVILIVVLGITFLERSVAPAWAIEQTIEAIKAFNGVHIFATGIGDNGKESKFELWARANEDFTSSEEFKTISEDGNILLVKDGKTFRYNPNTNVISVIPWKCASISPWLGSELLGQLKNFCDKWETSFARDATTGKDQIYLTCASTRKNESWCFVFDAESKLPVKFRQWRNSNTEGKPQIDIQSIVYYELMPENAFELKAPENAELIEKFPSPDKDWDKDADINSGMIIEDKSIEQSAIEVAKAYWHAIVDSDWESAAKLRPSLNARQRSELYSNTNLPTEIVSIGSAYQQAGCTLGLVVPCSIKFANDKTAEIKMIIRFLEIEETPICYVWGTWGNEYFGR